MKKQLAFLVTALALQSCIYKYTPNIDFEQVKHTLVVDGKILIGGTSTIQLTYLQPVSGAAASMPVGNVWIEDNKNNRFLPDETAQKQSNAFVIPTPPSGASEYRAVIECDGETYMSDWITPDPAPEIKEIRFEADASQVHVRADIKTDVNNLGYVGFTFEETWEFHSDFYPQIFVNPETWEYYVPVQDYPYYWCYKIYKDPGISVLDVTGLVPDDEGIIHGVDIKNFSRSDSRNHKKYSILLNAFALSKDAYDFNRQMAEMASAGGDLFTPDPGILPTNLSCSSHPERPVMGMVLAGGVSQKRVFFESTYYIPRTPNVNFMNVIQEDMPTFYYELNYRPVKRVMIEDEMVVGWAAHRCINCIEAGGTQEKPDYWK